MIKMSNHNITQRGTQATGLVVMIGRYSPDNQHRRPDRHATNVGCSFFWYINDDHRNHNDQRPQRKTWTREENQLALQCYFRSNPSQRGYRKKMIEIWQECSTFQTTSQRLADQIRTIVKKDDQRKDYINPKGPSKGTAPNNYRPITCLPMMWKILTAQIREKIYYSLTSRGLFPDEQKGCRKESRGTAELLYIDQHILNKNNTRRKNLAMAWIDNKKAYEMVPQSWIIHCLKMYKILHEVINFIEKIMQTWRGELAARGRSLAETKIQRGIFQGEALSPLLFIIAMMPLNHILRKCTAGYKLS